MRIQKFLEEKQSNLLSLKDYDIKKELVYLSDFRGKDGSAKYKAIRILDDFYAEWKKYFDSDDACSAIRRYLLFRYQYSKGGQFDCDHLDKVFKEHRLVDTFFETYFGYPRDGKKDTVFSVQYLWGAVIENFFPGMRNNFEWQFHNLDEIEKKMPDELFKQFGELMHYYHTIGNIMPCPGYNYNGSKGKIKYDRLDVFTESDTFKNSSSWKKIDIGQKEIDFLGKDFCEIFKIYSVAGDHLYDLRKPGLQDIEYLDEIFKNLNENTGKLIDYMKRVVEIIQYRSEELLKYAMR